MHFQTFNVVCAGSAGGIYLAGFPLVCTAQAYNLHKVGELVPGLLTSWMWTIRGNDVMCPIVGRGWVSKGCFCGKWKMG